MLWMAFLLACCRIVVGLTFGWSFLTKLRDPRPFVQLIAELRLLPAWLSYAAGTGLILAEGLLLLAMLIGGDLLIWGFMLAAALLIIFCAVLMLMLRTGERRQCHCFGASRRAISPYDVVRNLGFLLCALVGAASALHMPQATGVLLSYQWGLVAVVASLLAIFLMQLSAIMDLVR